MPSNTQKEYSEALKRLSALEKKLAAERAAQFRNLHHEYGFDTPAAFVAAYTAATRKNAPAKKSAQRRRRAKVTAAMIGKARDFFAQKMTARAVAKAIGVSLPTAQNIKKKLGLVTSAPKPAKPSKK